MSRCPEIQSHDAQVWISRDCLLRCRQVLLWLHKAGQSWPFAPAARGVRFVCTCDGNILAWLHTGTPRSRPSDKPLGEPRRPPAPSCSPHFEEAPAAQRRHKRFSGSQQTHTCPCLFLLQVLISGYYHQMTGVKWPHVQKCLIIALQDPVDSRNTWWEWLWLHAAINHVQCFCFKCLVVVHFILFLFALLHIFYSKSVNFWTVKFHKHFFLNSNINRRRKGEQCGFFVYFFVLVVLLFH